MSIIDLPSRSVERPAPRTLSPTTRSALAVLLLTSVHHAYGAYHYATPWRYHVLLLAIPTALVIAALDGRLRAHPADLLARSAFALIVLAVPIALIGSFEGFYNHVAKNALYFAGAGPSVMERLFPPSRYELPDDVFFEVTGVLQAALAALATWHLFRFVFRRPAAAAAEPDQPRTTAPPAVGATAPDFTLVDAGGGLRQLSDLCAHRPLVLVFYRGPWCPFCVRQLTQLRDRFAELDALGYGLAALSVDTPPRACGLAAQLELGFALLCDPQRVVIEQWGLLNRVEKGGIAYPATFVVDRDRMVRFRSLDRTASRVDLDGLFAFLRAGVGSAALPEPVRSFSAPRIGDLVNATINTVWRRRERCAPPISARGDS